MSQKKQKYSKEEQAARAARAAERKAIDDEIKKRAGLKPLSPRKPADGQEG